MTKKDYEAAARIVQEITGKIGEDCAEDRACIRTVTSAFVQLFANDSPRFDVARFRAACEPGANVASRRTRTLCPHGHGSHTICGCQRRGSER